MGLIGTILPPEMPASIPISSKWLSGQGGGVWFSIEKTNNSKKYRIIRYTPEGAIDCDRIFELIDNDLILDLDQPYEFVHISHCSKCRILQNNQLFIFHYGEPPTLKK